MPQADCAVLPKQKAFVYTTEALNLLFRQTTHLQPMSEQKADIIKMRYCHGFASIRRLVFFTFRRSYRHRNFSIWFRQYFANFSIYFRAEICNFSNSRNNSAAVNAGQNIFFRGLTMLFCTFFRENGKRPGYWQRCAKSNPQSTSFFMKRMLIFGSSFSKIE